MQRPAGVIIFHLVAAGLLGDVSPLILARGAMRPDGWADSNRATITEKELSILYNTKEIGNADEMNGIGREVTRHLPRHQAVTRPERSAGASAVGQDVLQTRRLLARRTRAHRLRRGLLAANCLRSGETIPAKAKNGTAPRAKTATAPRHQLPGSGPDGSDHTRCRPELSNRTWSGSAFLIGHALCFAGSRGKGLVQLRNQHWNELGGGVLAHGVSPAGHVHQVELVDCPLPAEIPFVFLGCQPFRRRRPSSNKLPALRG